MHAIAVHYQFDKPTKAKLKESIAQKYEGNYGTNLESVAINAIQAMVGHHKLIK